MMAETLVLEKKKISTLVFVGFLAIAIVAPLFLKTQFLSGPLVNAVLFIVTIMLGLRYGILVSLIPSGLALAIGLLPMVIAPMIPIIILGNMLMVISCNYLKTKNYWLMIVFSSIVKFVFIYVVFQIVFQNILDANLSNVISSMVGINQLYTALLGGALAFLFLKKYKKI